MAGPDLVVCAGSRYQVLAMVMDLGVISLRRLSMPILFGLLAPHCSTAIRVSLRFLSSSLFFRLRKVLRLCSESLQFPSCSRSTSHQTVITNPKLITRTATRGFASSATLHRSPRHKQYLPPTSLKHPSAPRAAPKHVFTRRPAESSATAHVLLRPSGHSLRNWSSSGLNSAQSGGE